MGGGDDYDYDDDTYVRNDDPDRGPSTTEQIDERAKEVETDDEVQQQLDEAEAGYDPDGDQEDAGGGDDGGAVAGGGGTAVEADAGGGAGGAGGDGVPPKPDEIPDGGYDHPEHYSDVLHESDVVDVDALAEADTEQEFAQAVFSDGALAPRHRDGGPGGVECLPVEEPSRIDRIGGWDDLDLEDGESATVVREANVESISGADSKVITDLPDSYASDRTFVQHYDDTPLDRMSSAEWWKAHSQMGVYSFLDASGVRTPRFTADLYDGWVAVEEAGTKTGVDTTELKSLRDSSVAEKVDSQEFQDQAAVNLLAQNWDLPPRNFRIGDDGSVHTFDYDYASRSYTDMSSMRRDADHAIDSLDRVNRLRSDEIDMTTGDVTDRAQEIAVSMRESGHEQRVLETVEQYDDAFPSKHIPRRGGFADRIEGTIDAMMPSD